MAGPTFDLSGVGVGAAQNKLCLRVVEGVLVEGGDGCFSPLMFRMAVAAVTGLLKTAMKPSFLIEVTTNVLVTVEA